jgi:hypothetical protein
MVESMNGESLIRMQCCLVFFSECLTMNFRKSWINPTER